MRYDPKKIEAKWQKRWLKDRIYEPDLKRAKRPFYNLMMFPYPSAEGLHIGSVRTFTGVDIYGRFKRMQGYDVFEPIGLDGFGIHSENYALKIGKHPSRHAKDSEKNFYRQLGATGNGFAWEEKLETYDPEYYKWTQWIFVQTFKRGLAYRKKAAVNWCPACLTVLADEQVLQGECERCQARIVKKELEQWFFRITDYAERLLKNLEKIDWPEPIKIAQRNWIGRSEGALVKFKVKSKKLKITGESLKFDPPKIPRIISREKYITVRLHPKSLKAGDLCELIDSTTGMKFAAAVITDVEKKKLKNVPERDGGLQEFKNRVEFYKTLSQYYGFTVNDNADTWLYHFQLIEEHIEVFTTRPDTLFGATYMVVTPEHPLIENYKLQITNYKEVEEYIKKARVKTEEERIIEGKEKTGVELKGIKAINPATKEEIPIWVADYVLGNVGTGAIMAVPVHDERDFEFAKKFNLPVREVIIPNIVDRKNPPRDGKKTVERKNIHAIVKDPKTGKYLALKWKKIDWVTFPMGGVEEGEDIVSAAQREVKEETGFVNLKLIKVLDGQVRAEYFATHKDENRIAYTNAILFELVDHTRVEVSEKERETHDVIWLDESKLNYGNMTHAEADIWNKRMHSKTSAYVGEGILINSGKFNGVESERAKWEITKFVNGERKVNYRLRDWLISRQRYWGPPIPMIYCEKCARLRQGYGGQGWQPVPEKDLPVKLPYIKDFRPTGTERSPLASVEKFYKVRCPKCKGWARRETDVSDTFLDSAWYYLRYPSVKDFRHPWNPAVTRKWLPVDMYIGGAEHAVLHLLYVRFLAMAFYDWGLLHFEEPFKKFRTHGLITRGGFKMSKSRGNIVNPDEYIKAYGTDAVRMYLAFMAPLDQGGDFRAEGIRGITRFLERVWRFVQKKTKDEKQKTEALVFSRSSCDRLIHKAVKKITEDIEGLQYNTAISALMTLLNEFEEKPEAVTAEHVKTFLLLLAPFAPHITEELYQEITNYESGTRSRRFKSVHLESWPEHDPKLIQEETFELVIQVNGKMRGRVTLLVGTNEIEAKEKALSLDAIRKFVLREPRKVVFIPNRLINFVV